MRNNLMTVVSKRTPQRLIRWWWVQQGREQSVSVLVAQGQGFVSLDDFFGGG